MARVISRKGGKVEPAPPSVSEIDGINPPASAPVRKPRALAESAGSSKSANRSVRAAGPAPQKTGAAAKPSRPAPPKRPPSQKATAGSSADPAVSVPRVSGRSPPVFVHSSFRTSSTWLWTRFRENKKAVAYCEIFHELLGTMTVDGIRWLNPGNWPSHHPPTSPYFLEFFGLIAPSGGVRGFTPNMSFEQYLPAGGIKADLSTNELEYVAGLISAAAPAEAAPILTDNRTMGRLVGLKRAFGGLHIFSYRNLFQQWNSYSDQHRMGNPYFIDTIQFTLQHARHDPYLDRLAHFLGFKPGEPDPDWLTRCPYDDVFVAFVGLHLYIYLVAFAAADLIIDVNRLATDPDYVKEIQGAVKDGSGLEIDLSGARNTIEAPLKPIEDAFAARLKIDALLAQAIQELAPTRGAIAFVRQRLADMWSEHEKFSFYARASLGHAARLEQAPAELVAARAADEARVQNLQAEFDLKLSELAAARANEAALLDRLNGLTTAAAGFEEISARAAMLESEKRQIADQFELASQDWLAREADFEEKLRNAQANVRDAEELASLRAQIESDSAARTSLEEKHEALASARSEEIADLVSRLEAEMSARSVLERRNADLERSFTGLTEEGEARRKEMVEHLAWLEEAVAQRSSELVLAEAAAKKNQTVHEGDRTESLLRIAALEGALADQIAAVADISERSAQAEADIRSALAESERSLAEKTEHVKLLEQALAERTIEAANASERASRIEADAQTAMLAAERALAERSETVQLLERSLDRATQTMNEAAIERAAETAASGNRIASLEADLERQSAALLELRAQSAQLLTVGGEREESLLQTRLLLAQTSGSLDAVRAELANRVAVFENLLARETEARGRIEVRARALDSDCQRIAADLAHTQAQVEESRGVMADLGARHKALIEERVVLMELIEAIEDRHRLRDSWALAGPAADSEK